MGKQFKKRNAPIIMSMSPLEHSLRYTRKQDKRETKKKEFDIKLFTSLTRKYCVEHKGEETDHWH